VATTVAVGILSVVPAARVDTEIYPNEQNQRCHPLLHGGLHALIGALLKEGRERPRAGAAGGVRPQAGCGAASASGRTCTTVAMNAYSRHLSSSRDNFSILQFK
jgi:hypothetical protein